MDRWKSTLLLGADQGIETNSEQLLSADQHTVWHHGHIITLINMFLITKDACCHCRSVYGIPTASIPEVTLSFVIASFPSCSWYQRSCTGFQKVSRGFHQWLQIHRCASLVPRPSPAQFSWLHMWPLNRPTSPGSSKVTFASGAAAWDRNEATGMPE